MIKGKFIDLVLIKVNGGQLTDESSVDRRVIRSYMPAAINFAMHATYNVNIQEEGTRDYASLFYAYYPNLNISVDTTRHNYKYITLPKGYVQFARHQGIRTIDDGCGYNLKPLSDNAFKTINHFKRIFTGDSYYRPEGTKVYLFGLPAPTTKVGASIIVDCDSLDDTDLLPLQAGFEKLAIDTCYEFVTGVRQMPADRKNDKRDVN